MRNRITVAIVVFLTLTLSATAALTITNNRQAYFHTSEDVEPAIVSLMRSGVETTVTVFMDYGLNGPLNYSTRLRYNSFANGNATLGTLASLPGDTGRYADPVLAYNKAATNAPGRIYAVGLHHASTTEPIASTVVRWYSDTGGTSWSAAGMIHQENGTPYLLDKPAVAVSSATGSAGYVYVAYVRVNRPDPVNSPNSFTREIVMKVSTNGGTTWQGPYVVSSGMTGTQAPQVMVDSNGDVYCLWTNWATLSVFHVAKSAPFTTTMAFGASAALTTPAQTRGTNVQVKSTAPSVSVRAATVPIAKLDAARDRIGVTWSLKDQDLLKHVVYFQTISIAGAQPVWQNNQRIVGQNGAVNLQPALDFDTNGNYVVTWYAFLSNSALYNHMGTFVSFDLAGNPVAEAPSLLHPVTSDLTPYTDVGGGARLLGEYHDIAYSNGSWKAVQIYIASWGNPWIFTITH
jgi:hypothetical protein